MITRFGIYFILSAALAVSTGCSSDDQTDNHSHSTAQTTHHEKKSDDDNDSHNRDIPPRVGMTKSQVMAKYGEPDSRSVDDSGEHWGYRLNFGEFATRGLNPFDMSGRGRLRFGQIMFGNDGRVKKFNWDTGTERD